MIQKRCINRVVNLKNLEHCKFILEFNLLIVKTILSMGICREVRVRSSIDEEGEETQIGRNSQLSPHERRAN